MTKGVRRLQRSVHPFIMFTGCPHFSSNRLMCYNFTHRSTIEGGDAPSIDNSGEYFKSFQTLSSSSINWHYDRIVECLLPLHLHILIRIQDILPVYNQLLIMCVWVACIFFFCSGGRDWSCSDQVPGKLARELKHICKYCIVVRVLTHTQIHQTSLCQRKAHLMEIQVNGNSVANEVNRSMS